MTKLTDLNRANEALPAKNVRCHHQNINPEQLCYVCKGENDVVDSLGSVHLEVDVEAMARINLNVIKSESLKNRNPYILPEHEYSEFCSCWGCKLSAVIAESNANNLSKWARLVRK